MALFWGGGRGVILLTASIFLSCTKQVLRTITDSKNKNSCDLFRKLSILTLLSQYVFSLCFVVMNRVKYMLNNDINGSNTIQTSNVHQAISNLTLYQRGACHMVLNIYNRLPACIKDIQ
jgi:hypothetical protein